MDYAICEACQCTGHFTTECTHTAYIAFTEGLMRDKNKDKKQTIRLKKGHIEVRNLLKTLGLTTERSFAANIVTLERYAAMHSMPIEYV
jgi:hypothetical protein